jgi:predicted translin family RNA/ssDNA-binding protein
MTDALLFFVLLAILYGMQRADERHKRTMEYLDSLADMTGDMLRELIETIKDTKKDETS